MSYPPLSPENCPPAEYAVVLSGSLHVVDDEQDDQALRFLQGSDRFFEALELLRTGRVQKLIFCGGVLPWSPEQTPEGSILKREALRRGFSPEQILDTPPARNTEEEARAVRRVLGESQDQAVVLLTSAFHLQRATLLFEQQGIRVVPYPCDFHPAQGQKMRWPWGLLAWIPSSEGLAGSSLFLREIYGWLFYRLKGVLLP